MSMKEMTQEDCRRIQQWMNHYSRKILGNETPYDVFKRYFYRERQSRGHVTA